MVPADAAPCRGPCPVEGREILAAEGAGPAPTAGRDHTGPAATAVPGRAPAAGDGLGRHGGRGGAVPACSPCAAPAGMITGRSQEGGPCCGPAAASGPTTFVPLASAPRFPPGFGLIGQRAGMLAAGAAQGWMRQGRAGPLPDHTGRTRAAAVTSRPPLVDRGSSGRRGCRRRVTIGVTPEIDPESLPRCREPRSLRPRRVLPGTGRRSCLCGRMAVHVL